MKKVLFIDRDGTIIAEPPADFQVDSLEKLEFVPKAIGALSKIAALDFELAMVTNQDGLGTASFPEETFWPAQNKMMKTLKGEGVRFDAVFIDPSLPEENKPTRKPGTAMLTGYTDGKYDLAGSFVIGDRLTDVRLAKNLGARAIFFQPFPKGSVMADEAGLRHHCALITDDWNEIFAFLRCGDRVAAIERKTRETDIRLILDLDGQGKNRVATGLSFFDHMLEQIIHHAGVSLDLTVKGDLHVDEHHTVEDTAIALGDAIYRALGSKLGIERYGYALPMDESDATVLLDFGGRIDFVWDAEFHRERVGDVPTEMFRHFFKSLCESARCNLHIRATGENEHHKIEGIFKAFARALKMAIARNPLKLSLPSSKGTL
ncbi:MAG: bifunctional histidinol-phosphatase/imidazoleglycerol-phosphate dehydratase HisB [Clostridium sp.]|nr:bifunctional histidinol-phosphatase/imidazoleglycerol-phosphate dehydratase HisB [Clostridium sp.]